MRSRKKNTPNKLPKASSQKSSESRNWPLDWKKNLPKVPIKARHYKARHPLAVRPAQSEIDERFAPYYERALSGDVEALVEYYKEFAWFEPDLGSAFYECLGYLATSPFPAQHRVVRKIMKLGVPLEDTITKKKIYQSWKDTILPVAQAAKSWIRRARASKEEPVTRGQLWREYWFEEVSDLEPHHQRQRRKTLSCVLTELDSNSSLPVIAVLNKCLPWGKIPKELFFTLAQTKPTIPASQAVRRLVCNLVGISEGTVSRKNLRKT